MLTDVLYMYHLYSLSDWKEKSWLIMNSSVTRPELIIPVYLELETLECAIVVLFITALGLIGNIIVILKILCDPAFHRPTYIVLLTLGLSDLICLIQYIVQAVIEHEDREFANENGEVFMAITYATTHASAAHVILFLGLRYFYVRAPIRARILQNKTIIKWSIAIWASSIVFGTLYFVLRFEIPNIDVQAVVLSFRGYLLFLPVCFMVYFHVQKVHELHHSINILGLTRQIRRMSRMLTVILSIYILSALLFPICFILIYNKICEEERECTHILIIARIMWLLNASINPVVYFIYSRRTRLFLESLFKKFAKRRNMTGRESIGMNNARAPVTPTRL